MSVFSTFTCGSTAHTLLLPPLIHSSVPPNPALAGGAGVHARGAGANEACPRRGADDERLHRRDEQEHEDRVERVTWRTALRATTRSEMQRETLCFASR